MLKRRFLKCFLPLFLAGSCLCVSCSPGKAASMWLKKTEGLVAVADENGKDIEPKEDLKLFSGYAMETQDVSYAWINLDDVKLAKMDENSEVEIEKDGKDLEVRLESGGLFFNVKEPLEEDETMNIRTSSMLVGIRGTCGWAVSDGEKHSQVYILEGTVAVSGSGEDQALSVTSGEMADVTVTDDGETAITVEKFSVKDIPEFALAELEADEALARGILDASGLDVLNPPDENELARASYGEILEEYLDARENGLPYSEYPEYDESLDQAAWQARLDENDRNYESNLENYPHVSSYFQIYYMSEKEHADPTPLYSAYYDIDGNGIEEMIVGIDNTGGYDERIHIIGVYAFDGSASVKLAGKSEGWWTMGSCLVAADGTFIDAQGNGGITSGEAYRIGDDGCSLVSVPLPDIPAGSLVYSMSTPLDLSSHGGYLADLLDWNLVQ